MTRIICDLWDEALIRRIIDVDAGEGCAAKTASCLQESILSTRGEGAS